MRKKRWLTAGMAVIAAAAVIMAATSYNEIRKKLNMQCENQKTMLVAGYELQTENTEKEKDVESESSSGKKIQTKSEKVKESVEETKATESSETKATESSETKATESSDKETETQKATEKETTAKSGAPVVKLRKTKSVIQAGEGFDATYQVESITDDKDERSFLFGQIQISGDYSTDEPGTYTLTYTAMDSDGNVSAPVTLELVVKG